jgi:ribosome biogenesis GTPase A
MRKRAEYEHSMKKEKYAKKGISIAGVGLPAAGKSTILKVLAEKKGWSFRIGSKQRFDQTQNQ